MTQEELMDLIDKFDAAGMVNEPAVKALRAVVNLHWHNDIKSPTGEVLETYCTECPNLSWYPCLTIQVIEKELS